MDVNQYHFGSLFHWKSISTFGISIRFHQDIHHLCGHPSATQQTSIRTAVDVHQLSYGRPSVFILTSTVPLLTSIGFQKDILLYLCGRLSAFIGTSIRTSVDVHQLSYGRFSVPLWSLWTFVSFHRDTHHLCRNPSAIKRTTIRTVVDVHQLSYGDAYKY